MVKILSHPAFISFRNPEIFTIYIHIYYILPHFEMINNDIEEFQQFNLKIMVGI